MYSRFPHSDHPYIAQLRAFFLSLLLSTAGMLHCILYTQLQSLTLNCSLCGSFPPSVSHSTGYEPELCPLDRALHHFRIFPTSLPLYLSICSEFRSPTSLPIEGSTGPLSQRIPSSEVPLLIKLKFVTSVARFLAFSSYPRIDIRNRTGKPP